MKKTDKIIIWRKENGFIIEIEDEMGVVPHLIFVYNKQRDLIEDMEEFLSAEQLLKSDEKVKEEELPEQGEMEYDEE